MTTATALRPVYVYKVPDALVFDPLSAQPEQFPYRARMTAEDVLDAIAPEWKSLPEQLVFLLNGVQLDNFALKHKKVASGDVAHLIITPGGPQFFVAFFLSTAISIAANALFGAKPPRAPEDDGSQTYGWGSPRTQYRGVGLPKMMPYGIFAHGGIAIERYSEVINGPEPVSILHVTICYGYGGPVGMAEIGGYTSDQDFLVGDALPAGCKINGNDIKNYEGIVAHIRMGSVDQAPIPTANALRTEEDVDLPLTQNTEESGDAAITDYSLASTYDLLSEGHSATLRFEFPGGLGAYDSGSGAVDPETVEIDIRYQELDGGGLPVGSYREFSGNPISITADKISAPFYSDQKVFFKDTAESDPVPEDACEFNDSGVNDYALADSANISLPLGAGTWTPGSQWEFLSVEVYSKVNSTHGLTHSNWIFSWQDATAGTNETLQSIDDTQPITGIAVRLNPPVTVQQPFYTQTLPPNITVYAGDGSSFIERTIPFSLGEGDWLQLGIDWDRVNENKRLRVILNGNIVIDETLPFNLVQPSSPIHIGMHDAWTSGSTGCQLTFAQCSMWHRALTSSEWFQRWNGGLGTWQDSTVSDLILCYQFATVTGSLADVSPLGNDATFQATQSQVTGLLIENNAFNLKLSRYRIQVQRRDLIREEGSQTVKDVVRWRSVVVEENEQLAYPNLALVRFEIPAQDQLSDNFPSITMPGRWRQVPVWDQNSAGLPTFPRAFSRNVAWCIIDAASSKNGLGSVFNTDGSFPVIEWQKFADFCDETLWNGRKKVIPEDNTYIMAYLESTEGNNPFGFDAVIFQMPSGEEFREQHIVGTLIDFEGSVPSALEGTWVEDVFSNGPYEIAGKEDTGGLLILAIEWPPNDDITAPASQSQETIDTDMDLLGVERRMTLDGIAEARDGRAWDVLLSMAFSARASLVRVGKLLVPVWERERSPTFLFNRDNVIVDTVEVSAVKSEEFFNVAVMEIQNEKRNYVRDPIARQHSSLRNASTASAISRRSIDGIWITRESQARRELDFHLERAQTVRTRVRFQSLLSGLLAEAYNVVLFGLDLPNFGEGGVAGDDSESSRELVLDIAHTFDRTKTYSIAVTDSDSNLVGVAMLDYERNFLFDPEDLTTWDTGASPTVTANQANDSDGNLTLDQVEDNNVSSRSRVFQYVDKSRLVHGRTYTASCEVRNDSGDTEACIWFFVGGANTTHYARAEFDFSGNTLNINTADGTGNGVPTATATDLGGGLWRLTATLDWDETLGDQDGLYVNLYPAFSNSTATGSKFFGAVQVEEGAEFTTYDSQDLTEVTRNAGERVRAWLGDNGTAPPIGADIVARDEDRISVKNLLLDTVTIGPIAGTKWQGFVTLTQVDLSGPYGEPFYWRVNDTSASNLQSIYQEIEEANLIDGVTYVGSVLLKLGTTSISRVEILTNTVSTFTRCEIDWTVAPPTATLGTTSGPGTHEVGIEDVGDGWYRFHVTLQWNTGNGLLRFQVRPTDPSDVSDTGYVEFLKPQVEIGETPTTFNEQGAGTETEITPEVGDAYAIGVHNRAAKEFVVKGKKLTQDFRIEWLLEEYSQSANQLTGQDEIQQQQFAVTAPLGGSGEFTKALNQAPENVQGLTVAELSIRDSGSQEVRPGIDVSFLHDPATALNISKTIIWIRRSDWARPKKIATVRGQGTRTVLRGEEIKGGYLYRIYAQPVMSSGARLKVDVCRNLDLWVAGYTTHLDAPTNMAAQTRGNEVLYTWDNPEQNQVKRVECRVGGWILGQPLWSSPGEDLSFGPTGEAFIYGPTNERGETAPRLFIRNVLPGGQVSSAADEHLGPFYFQPIGAGVTVEHSVAYEDSSFGTPTLTNLTTITDPVESITVASFDGSNLEGEIVTPTIDLTRATRHVANAFAEARQIAPYTLEDFTAFEMDSPFAQQFSLEGKLWIGRGESVECQGFLEWQFSDGADPTLEDWVPFRPGVAYFRSARFRWRMTRPDTTFDAYVRRFGVVLSTPPAYDPGDIDGGELS